MESNKRRINKKVIISVVAVIVIAAVIALVIILGGEKRYDDPAKQLKGGYFGNETDYDEDGLDNDRETELGTNLWSADTDSDGLGDYYEVNDSKTNPVKIDTDGDGINDGVELIAGLNPLLEKTDGETDDADRTFEDQCEIKNDKDKVYVKFSGDANLYGAYFKEFEVTGLAYSPGVVSHAYEVYNPTGLQNAEIVFEYDEKYIKSRGCAEENLSICIFDGEEYTKVKGSTLDTEKNQVSASISDAGKYLLCDLTVASEENNIQAMLLIDNSGSMYPEEMCEGSNGNDVDFKRLDMAKAIIENIDGVDYGLAKFTKTYTHLCGLGATKEDLFGKLEGIRNGTEEFNGTYIATSIINSLDNFTEEHAKNRKFVIILTDGETTENKGLFGLLDGAPRETDAIKKCNEANVTVITIALGNEVDEKYLRKISDGTGGAYIYVNNDTALEDVYASLVKHLDYSREVIEPDEEVESYIVADSGFDAVKNGFDFTNFAALVPNNSIQQHGVCHGMALLAQAHYRGVDVGSSYTYGVKRKGDYYNCVGYNISDMLEENDNLSGVEGGILEKWAAIHSIPSEERYEWVDGVMRYKEEILEKYPDEYFTVKEYKYELDEDMHVKKEMLYVDIEKYLMQTTVREDMELAKALYWLWGTQIDELQYVEVDEFSLGSADIMPGAANTGNTKDFEKLSDRLEAGVPLTIGFDSHSVNAIRLLRDEENPCVYYLEYYDNNGIGKIDYLKIEQSGFNAVWKLRNALDGEDANYAMKAYKYEDGEWVSTALKFFELKSFKLK